MGLKKLPFNLTVCKVKEISAINLKTEFFFIGKTNEELSLVCRTEDVPQNTAERDNGWKGLILGDRHPHAGDAGHVQE